jgi:hypothetical protein
VHFAGVWCVAGKAMCARWVFCDVACDDQPCFLFPLWGFAAGSLASAQPLEIELCKLGLVQHSDYGFT